MSQYKYYWRKPRTAITKDIITWLLVGGALVIASTGPAFGVPTWNAFQQSEYKNRYKKRKFTSTFTRLKRQGLVRLEQRGYDVHVSLTKKGRGLAGYMQIDALEVKRPKRWDGKWRLVLFDIAEQKKLERNALRAKLRELGFLPYQRSVWIHPFDCRDEIQLLKSFFGLADNEVSLVVAQEIEATQSWQKRFNLD